MDLATVLKNAQHPSKNQLGHWVFDYLGNVDLEIRSQAEAYLNQAVEAQYVSERKETSRLFGLLFT